jgi:hypothetical protein
VKRKISLIFIIACFSIFIAACSKDSGFMLQQNDVLLRVSIDANNGVVIHDSLISITYSELGENPKIYIEHFALVYYRDRDSSNSNEIVDLLVNDDFITVFTVVGTGSGVPTYYIKFSDVVKVDIALR